jgi:CAI-1 autoinducer synthase
VGSEPGPDAILLSGNDYLVLANDRRIIDAQIEAMQESSSELFMSGVYVQYLENQRAFEQEMAEFLGAEEAVLCQSGFAANDGLIQSLADETTPVYLDMQAHASLWQGAMSAGAPAHPVRHNNAEHLRSLVAKHGPGVVAVDALYSTLGTFCRINEFLEVCEATGCILVVDESHAMGVVGKHGEGLVSSLGLADRVHYRTFSLSKAYVGRAGMVIGPRRVLEFLRFESRVAIFSSAVMPWEVARFRKTFEIVKEENWRREKVWRNADYLRSALDEVGYNVESSESPIIPLESGTEPTTKTFRDALEREGVFGAVFCAPATPKNRSLVRFCVTADLTQEALDKVVDVCARVGNEVGFEDWPSTRRKGRKVQVLRAVSRP